MASLSGGLNPNAIKTALDEVFVPGYTGEQHPGHATAETSAIFHQDSTDRSAVIGELFKGVGYWQPKQEEQDVTSLSPRIGNQKTFTVSEYAGSVDVPRTFKRDDLHGVFAKMVTDMGVMARVTRDKNAFALFVNAFGTTTTADGVSLINDSHVALDGTTVDNNIGAALTETTLFTAIRTLYVMKCQDGTVRGSLAKSLLVPPALYKLATEITESSLRSGTGNNDLNVYSTKYGVNVYTTPFISSAVSGGSDTAWFVLSDAHSIYRWVREGVQTVLVPWQNQRNNNFIYKGMFSEVVGAVNYEGIVGSAT